MQSRFNLHNLYKLFFVIAGKRIGISPDAHTGDLVACENCGKLEPKSKLKKKPFCSPICAKTAKTSPEMEKPIPVAMPDESLLPATDDTTVTSATTPFRHSPLSATATPATNNVQPIMATSDTNSCPVKPQKPAVAVTNDAVADSVDQGPEMQKWTVAEVCDFIRSLPGCSDYAEDFENQEIDGQALLLLKPNNLVGVMGIKLGPALKIIDRVNIIRGAVQDD